MITPPDTTTRPPRWTVWWLAARPKTLLASLAPVAIGTVLAWHDGKAHVPSMLAALLGAVAIQIGTNFCNDYCDFFQGADTEQRKGPTRAVQAGWVSPASMLWATSISFAIAGLLSFYLAYRAGWFFGVLGMISIGCGILYTAGRYSLAYLGWGDPFVLVFFGPVAVGGTYYVQALELTTPAMLAGWAPGLLAVGLLVVNNLRDIDEDRLAGKRTLAVRLGAGFSRYQYALCILGAAAVPVLLAAQGFTAGLPAVLVALPGAAVARKVFRRSGADLKPCLGMTAGLLLLYTLLFCAGVLWS